jgi:hypothetical protein
VTAESIAPGVRRGSGITRPSRSPSLQVLAPGIGKFLSPTTGPLTTGTEGSGDATEAAAVPRWMSERARLARTTPVFTEWTMDDPGARQLPDILTALCERGLVVLSCRRYGCSV